MPPHPLRHFEVQYYQNESKFNGVYSKSKLSKIKNGAYVKSFDTYESIGTPYWLA